MLEFTLQPSVDDYNAAGHIDNVTIYAWLDRQRTALILDAGFVFGSDCFPSIVKAVIEYRAELDADAPVSIQTGIERIGTSSFTIRQSLFQRERLCVSLESVAVNVCSRSKSSLAIPADLVASLSSRQAA